LSEEAVEFTAGGVEGALRLLRAVVNQRAPVFVDGVPEQSVSRPLSESRVVVEVADDLSAQYPKIVHMPANGLGGETL
jgi:hypothetical protein